ncbi:MAG: PspC domain-containing protein [Nocardioidaceae bacterium]
MSETSTGGPRITGDQLRDLNRLRRAKDDRMIAGVAAGLARHLDIDPTIVRVVFGALTIFGGAGILLYCIAWLTIPDEGQVNSAASDLLKRDPQVVMFVGLILAAAVAGMTMMGTLVWSAPNPWPIMVVAVLAAVGLVIFSRRPESPLPPPSGGSPAASPGATYGEATAPDIETQPDAAVEGEPPHPPQSMQPPPSASPPSPPPPPAPRRPRSRLLPITLCVILLAEGAIWLVDNAADVDVHPSVYPGAALGIVASALLIGAWYGRSRLLILVGIVASLATVVATVIGPGPHGESVYTPRAAADVKDRYEHGAGVIELHLEEVSDIDALAGRTIEVDANVGQVIILVPTSIDATIDAEVTGGGDIEGLPDVEEFGHGEAKAGVTPVDDEDPDVAIDISLRFGQVKVRYWECRDHPIDVPAPGQQIIEPTGASDVTAACN